MSDLHIHTLHAQKIRRLRFLFRRIDNILTKGYRLGMANSIGTNLASNMRQLREARGMTQEQMSRISDIPCPTWANLESGASNPTLSVRVKAATALQVPADELTGRPRAVV